MQKAERNKLAKTTLKKKKKKKKGGKSHLPNFKTYYIDMISKFCGTHIGIYVHTKGAENPQADPLLYLQLVFTKVRKQLNEVDHNFTKCLEQLAIHR